MPRITITEPGKTPQPYRFDLSVDQMRIGRRSENEIVVACGSASGNHAKMVRIPGGFELLDLDSTNGLLRNGERLNSWRLSDGDHLLLGDIAFDFQLSEEEVATLGAEVATPPTRKEPESVVISEPEVISEPKSVQHAAVVSRGSGNFGSWVMLAFCVLAVMAFLKGVSVRHESATGVTLGQRLFKSDVSAPATNEEATTEDAAESE